MRQDQARPNVRNFEEFLILGTGFVPAPDTSIELSDTQPTGAVLLLWKFPEHTPDPFVQP